MNWVLPVTGLVAQPAAAPAQPASLAPAPDAAIARAAELRTRLTTRLSDLEKRYAELQTKVIDLTAQRGELAVELSEALREVTLRTAPVAVSHSLSVASLEPDANHAPPFAHDCGGMHGGAGLLEPEFGVMLGCEAVRGALPHRLHDAGWRLADHQL